MQIEDKRAVVTGAGAGIGRAIALELARRGNDVVVADVQSEAASAVAKEVESVGRRGVAVVCDVSDPGAVESLADQAWADLGGVDLLFNNAGVGTGAAVLDGSLDNLRWIFEVNLFGLWKGCSVFGKRFVEQDTPAWICNTGSEHSLGFAHAGMGFYTASKHAVLGLSDVLRHELPDHVGVSVLCPGMVSTELWNATRNRPERFGGSEQADALSQQILGEGMDAEEIGRRAVDGVEAEEFLIPTHSVTRGHAETRWNEISAAFDRQAPYREGDERYDVTNVMQRVLANQSNG